MDTYREGMIEALEDIDMTFVAVAERALSEQTVPHTHFELAVLSLWKIIGFNLFSFVSIVEDKRKFYAAAGNARLILECVADAHYLADHQEEAEQYYKNQEKIQDDLSQREGQRWNAFIEGTVNQYGALREPTKKRIKAAIGKDAMGAYNFLCFYTHPNSASSLWLSKDQTGKHAIYLMGVLSDLLVSFLKLIQADTSLPVSDNQVLKIEQSFTRTFGGDKRFEV